MLKKLLQKLAQYFLAKKLIVTTNTENGDNEIMTINFDEIIEACMPILQNVKHHRMKNRTERRFITAYQVWELLQNDDEQFTQRLKDACGTENVTPIQKIAQALGRSPNEIDTHYLDTRYLAINEFPLTKEDCGIFRLRE